MFSLLLVTFLSLFMLGLVGFMPRLKIKNCGISATAYEPLFNRLLFHHAGLETIAPPRSWRLICLAVAECGMADGRDNGVGGQIERLSRIVSLVSGCKTVVNGVDDGASHGVLR